MAKPKLLRSKRPSVGGKIVVTPAGPLDEPAKRYAAPGNWRSKQSGKSKQCQADGSLTSTSPYPSASVSPAEQTAKPYSKLPTGFGSTRVIGADSPPGPPRYITAAACIGSSKPTPR